MSILGDQEEFGFHDAFGDMEALGSDLEALGGDLDVLGGDLEELGDQEAIESVEALRGDLEALGDWERIEDIEALANYQAPPLPPRAFRAQITLSLRSKVRSLRNIALWPFRRIAESVHLPLSTVFSICAQPGTQLQPNDDCMSLIK